MHYLVRSAVVALTVSTLVPAAWIAFTGTTYRTPQITLEQKSKMSAAEIDKWVEDNKQQASFVEHATGIPRLIKNHSTGYLQVVAGLFVAVFLVNLALTKPVNE